MTIHDLARNFLATDGIGMTGTQSSAVFLFADWLLKNKSNKATAELEAKDARIKKLEDNIIEAMSAFTVGNVPEDIEAAELGLVRMCHIGAEAMDELESMRTALDEALQTIVGMKNCVADNAGMRNEYQDFDEVHELAQAWLDKYAGETKGK